MTMAQGTNRLAYGKGVAALLEGIGFDRTVGLVDPLKESLPVGLHSSHIYIYIYMVPPPKKKNYVHITFAGICNILCLFWVAF